MKNLTIKSDLINHTIQIIYGFEVDYNPTLKNKDYNNNGVWGKIIDAGRVVHSIVYNPNRCGVNFGETDYSSKLSFMKRQLAVYKSLQPKQIESIINN